MRRYKFTGISLRIGKESLRLYCLNLRDSIVTIAPQVKTDILVYDRPLPLKHINPSVLKERISNGEKIFVAHHKSNPVAYLFATDTQCCVGEVEDRFKLGVGEVYFYDAYTDTEYRGNRIYSSLICNAARYFKDLFYSTAFIFTTSSNTISIKGIEKSGFHHYQTIHFYDLCGWRMWDYGKRSKNVASRFSNEA